MKKSNRFLLLGLLLIFVISIMAVYGLTYDVFSFGIDDQSIIDVNNLESGEINDVSSLSKYSAKDLDVVFAQEFITLKNGQILKVSDIKSEMDIIQEKRDPEKSWSEKKKKNAKPQDLEDVIIMLRTDDFLGSEADIKSEYNDILHGLRTKLQEFGVDDVQTGSFGNAELYHDDILYYIRAWDKINTIDDLMNLSNQSEKESNRFITNYNIALQQNTENRAFETKKENDHDPSTSASTKILETSADLLGTNTIGKLNIYVEKPLTQIEKEVYSQFADQYPNVEINIYYDSKDDSN